MSDSSEANTYVSNETAEHDQAQKETAEDNQAPKKTAGHDQAQKETAEDERWDLFRTALDVAAASAGDGNRYNKMYGWSKGTDKGKGKDNGKDKDKGKGNWLKGKGKSNDNESKGKGKGNNYNENWLKGKGTSNYHGWWYNEPKGKGKGKDYNEICEVVKWLHQTVHKQARIIVELRERVLAMEEDPDIENDIDDLRKDIDDLRNMNFELSERMVAIEVAMEEEQELRRERDFWRRKGWWTW